MLEKGAATIGWRLSYLANFYVGPVYKRVSHVNGLARSEFVVLYCLERLGTLTAQDIVEITGRPKNSISQAVSKLTAAGHVCKEQDADDARRSHLRLTRSGQKACDEVIPCFVEREQDMLAVLSAQERKQFETLLEKLTLREDGWDEPF